MTREELVALGLTEEQVNSVMASHGKDIQSANAKADKYKAGADEADSLRQQLDEIQNKNLSDIERVTKANEDLTKQINELKFAKSLADKNITGETADKIMKAFNTGDFDSLATVMDEIATSNREAGAVAKEQEIAKNAVQPPVNGAPDSGADKTSAETIAESLFAKGDSSAKSSADIISSYTS